MKQYPESSERASNPGNGRHGSGLRPRRWRGVAAGATIRCGRCSSTGSIWTRPSPGMIETKTCPVCGGEGRVSP